MLSGMRSKVEEIHHNPVAWEIMLKQELKVYKDINLANSGEFLLLRGTK